MTGDVRSKTAFVFAGGGSFGAIHVGMLHALARRGIAADMVVGSSVGALNGAYYAGNPTIEGIQQLEAIWRGLRRSEVFPMSWRTIMGFLYRRDFLIPSDGLRQLVDRHLTYRNLEDAKVPVHIVATDILSGGTACCRKVRPRKPSLRAPQYPQLSHRCISTISILPMGLYRATRRSRWRSRVVRGA